MVTVSSGWLRQTECTGCLRLFPRHSTRAPCAGEAAHHLADSTLGDAEPAGKVLTGDHQLVTRSRSASQTG